MQTEDYYCDLSCKGFEDSSSNSRWKTQTCTEWRDPDRGRVFFTRSQETWKQSSLTRGTMFSLREILRRQCGWAKPQCTGRLRAGTGGNRTGFVPASWQLEDRSVRVGYLHWHVRLTRVMSWKWLQCICGKSWNVGQKSGRSHLCEITSHFPHATT